jgi:plastocyanin domain-containing protein
VIEFTPRAAGTIQYSCWMGMIRGSITVAEAGAVREQERGAYGK